MQTNSVIKTGNSHFGLLAVDPGYRAMGWALFQGDQLESCGLARGVLLSETVSKLPVTFCNELVVEDQQIYRTTKARHADILKLAQSAGAVIGAVKHFNLTMYLPRQWKGTVPKEVFARRILTRLSEHEMTIFDSVKCPKSMRHNIVDAIGLGLFKLRRI